MTAETIEFMIRLGCMIGVGIFGLWLIARDINKRDKNDKEN